MHEMGLRGLISKKGFGDYVGVFFKKKNIDLMLGSSDNIFYLWKGKKAILRPPF